MATRRRPVLAMFGSVEDATLEPAECVGREIALRGATLLTGGMRPGADAVKERAIRGAESVGDRARWIGVPGREAAAGDPLPTATSLVLPLGYGDRRNCVEAHLCDAAIAFRGGPGTVSEVAFCLAFGRPVVLVGFADAGPRFPVEDDPAARARYVEQARRAVPVPTVTTPAEGIDRLVLAGGDRRRAAGGVPRPPGEGARGERLQGLAGPARAAGRPGRASPDGYGWGLRGTTAGNGAPRVGATRGGF